MDLLTVGRLRLGIGVGWNDVEYEALGEDFSNRGRRCEEQIELLRALWTQDMVDFHGRYHQVTHAGISPISDIWNAKARRLSLQQVSARQVDSIKMP